MPAPGATSDNYLSFRIDLDTGVASKGVWLCIAQLPSRSKQEIEADTACPQNVEILSEILGTVAGQQHPLLKRDAQPGQLPVLVCPEYTFGSDDWARVDSLVEAFPSSLLLVAGFGQTPLAGLAAVRECASSRGLTLHCGWEDEPDQGGRAMNFGCVWVKKPDNSREAVLFGKNFLEARAEDLNGVFKFTHLTEIVFDDLRLLPFICADALETPKPGAGATVTQRLTRRIVGQHTPALCIGSLMQCGRQASETWVKAIDGLIHDFGDAQVALVIANVANPTYDARKGGGDWRNLSGIYVSKRKYANGQKRRQESTAYFDSPNLMAWPLRSTLPQLAFGTVCLHPYATDSGLHPWNSLSERSRCTICCEQAPRIRKYIRSGLQDELLLLSEVTGCEVGGNILQFQHVKNHLQVLPHEIANALVSRLLDGPLLPSPKLRSASDLCEKCLETLGHCLSCLDAVMEGSEQTFSADDKFSWVSTATAVGDVVTLGTEPIPVALWWSIDSSTPEMLADLRQRAYNYGGAVLRVFGKGRDGDIANELWMEMCVDTTTATDLPVATGETEHPYADLSTIDAASIVYSVKPRGFQSLLNLVQLRCERGRSEFMSGYARMVRTVQS